MADGIFLSLDGLDGAGKTTQCTRLARWLRETTRREVVECRDPGGTDVGGEIRRLLLDVKSLIGLPCEALLYMASRAQLVDAIIRPALKQGAIVLCDRFDLSTVVYQGHAGGLDPNLLRQANRLATGGLEPAWTGILDLPPEAAAARRCHPADRIESRSVEFFDKVRRGFLHELKQNARPMQLIDASGSPDEVHDRLREAVAHVVGRSRRP